MKCVVIAIVRPARAFCSNSHVERREYGSMPDVGSSSMTILEPPMSAMDMESFRFWPPESVPACALHFSVSPTCACANDSVMGAWAARQRESAQIAQGLTHLLQHALHFTLYLPAFDALEACP
jgi:hypothetical protein